MFHPSHHRSRRTSRKPRQHAGTCQSIPVSKQSNGEEGDGGELVDKSLILRSVEILADKLALYKTLLRNDDLLVESMDCCLSDLSLDELARRQRCQSRKQAMARHRHLAERTRDRIQRRQPIVQSSSEKDSDAD
jgi:hypothetical protein